MTFRFWSAAWLSLLLAGCASAPPAPTVKPGTIGWRPVETFSGHGNSQTESFNIESGGWRIKWEASNPPSAGAGTITITAHSAVSGRPIAVVVDHRKPGRDIAYVNDDPRLYHLVVESNLDWKMAVEEAVAAR